MDFPDIDIDDIELGIALGLGEEIADEEIERKLAQDDNDEPNEPNEGNQDEIKVPLSSRNKELKFYYDPFLHYASEVAEGKRRLGDTEGIYFVDYDDGPDEDGNYHGG